MDRRQFLAASAATVAVAGLARTASALSPAQQEAQQAAPVPAGGAERAALKGRIRHSVCRWCYGGMELDSLAAHAAAMGIQSVEILDEHEWPVVFKHGLTCAVANGPGPIHRGWNRVEHHDALVARSTELLPKIAAAGIPAMVAFSGNRDGLSDEDGVRHCITGLQRIMPLAEQHGVTVVMELLNSKVDHADYHFDNMAFGVAIVKGVGSPRFRILYDIYHAQIMEGDVIRTIRENAEHIGHYHTGGVPGRNEIDETQELNYAAICRAIADTGYTGFVGQEFIPARDAMTSLRQAITICDV